MSTYVSLGIDENSVKTVLQVMIIEVLNISHRNPFIYISLSFNGGLYLGLNYGDRQLFRYTLELSRL